MTTWQVDQRKDGTTARVWVEKPTGKARGLWTFESVRQDDGSVTLEVSQALPEAGVVGDAGVVAAWTIDDVERLRDAPAPGNTTELESALASLVGWRTAGGVIRRLWPAGGPKPLLTQAEAEQMLAEVVDLNQARIRRGVPTVRPSE